MLGKKSDHHWSFDAIQELIWQRFGRSVEPLACASHALLLAFASDFVYESRYKPHLWQLIAFPVLSWKLKKIQRLIKSNTATADDIATARRVVSALEFRDKAPPDRYLHIVRTLILKHNLTNGLDPITQYRRYV